MAPIYIPIPFEGSCAVMQIALFDENEYVREWNTDSIIATSFLISQNLLILSNSTFSHAWNSGFLSLVLETYYFLFFFFFLTRNSKSSHFFCLCFSDFFFFFFQFSVLSNLRLPLVAWRHPFVWALVSVSQGRQVLPKGYSLLFNIFL